MRINNWRGAVAILRNTESIPVVDKIVGPGNAFVNEARRQAFGKDGIGALAGPSEIYIIADDSANSQMLAADLLAQAEHDVHTRVGMATISLRIANEALAEIERQLENLPTAATVGEAWHRQGEIVVCRDEAQLIAWADYTATEHLQVHTRDPHATASKIRHYGSLFIGQNASVVFSDKCCGTNHTLPTMAAARYTGGLWIRTYVKICTHQWIDDHGIAAVAEPAVRQSRTEGMQAHRRAAEIRLCPEEIEGITSGKRD